MNNMTDFIGAFTVGLILSGLFLVADEINRTVLKRGG